MKINKIPDVIFQTNSQFFFKYCITLQCHDIFSYNSSDNFSSDISTISSGSSSISSNIKYFNQKEPIKTQIFETFKRWIKILQIQAQVLRHSSVL